jgi:hypothetical protein
VAREASIRGAALEPWKDEVVGDDESVGGGEYTRRCAVVSVFNAYRSINCYGREEEERRGGRERHVPNS